MDLTISDITENELKVLFISLLSREFYLEDICFISRDPLPNSIPLSEINTESKALNSLFKKLDLD